MLIVMVDLDHCGLNASSQQLYCARDIATCYTDKFPYCLSACLDGYTFDTITNQCVVTGGVSVAYQVPVHEPLHKSVPAVLLAALGIRRKTRVSLQVVASVNTGVRSPASASLRAHHAATIPMITAAICVITTIPAMQTKAVDAATAMVNRINALPVFSVATVEMTLAK